MAETAVLENETDMGAETLTRVYEIGYHVSPATKEGDVDTVVSEIRSLIEKEGGRLLAEGAPSLTKLSYSIPAIEGGKRIEYDRGYFGWIKFEGPVASATTLEEALKRHTVLMRAILFRTVREETRARFKTQTLREVKRTDTLKPAPRAPEESATPISEADLEKAIQDIIAE